ncbi:aldolase/citrate lyase family protein [Halobellus sp. GM3]|uniref:aldolase/citrate lyase family protein n=1 Tax=Halobellus sp. GM3 TaxID=3458410 RepID=UPI00403E26B2
MDEIRSILYVPAHHSDWVAAATTHGADAVILDLEDSVPVDQKPTAREALDENKSTLAEAETVITVRTNEFGSELFYEDIESLGEWVDAVVVPKIESAETVSSIETLLEYVEAKAGLEDRIGLIPLLESPGGVYNAHDILAESDRISAVGGGTSRGGDIQQSLDLGWSAEGSETMYLRSKLVLEAKTAGVDQILSGIWSTVDDEDGLREKARRQRQFGFTGMQVIHPSQVTPVNEVFTPDADTVEYYRELVEAFERSQGSEQGVIEFDGEMVDAAKVKKARRVLERSEVMEPDST